MWCECSRCSAGGAHRPYDLALTYYQAQSRLFLDCVESAREARPGLEVSIWTTQGSRPYDEALIRSLPKHVLWFYYDGERHGNYNLRRMKTLPAEIIRLRAEGYRIGAQLDFASSGGLLFTPGRIGELCREAAEARLKAVAGWIRTYPLNREAAKGGAHPVLAYAAEMLRNPLGHGGATLERVMRAAALDAGHDPTTASAAGHAWQAIDGAARDIYLSDTYSYWWHGTSVIGAICRRIVTRAAVDEIDQRWTDAAWSETIPALDAADDRLERERQALEAVADATGYAPH